MSKVIRYGLIGLLALAVLGAVIYVIKSNRTAGERYAVEKPQLRTIVAKTMATGKIVPRREIEIKPNISGIVNKIYAREGQKIKKGDLIARVAVVRDIKRLNDADSGVRNAQIAVENSRKDYERQKKLFEQGVIAAADFQQVETRYHTDLQNLLKAKRNLEIIKTGSARGLGGAGNTLIRSTVTGTVLDIPVEVGSQVTEANNFNRGTTIADVADLGDMIFDGTVDESDVGSIQEGVPVDITVGALPDTTFKGKIDFISPKGEDNNGAIEFQIKASVRLIQGLFLRSGYSANASVVLHRAKGVLSIPEALLQYDTEGKPYVEVKTGANRYEKKEVVLGISDNNYVQIKSGITKEDAIKVWNPTTREKS